jgi:hypothetical protein
VLLEWLERALAERLNLGAREGEALIAGVNAPIEEIPIPDPDRTE